MKKNKIFNLLFNVFTPLHLGMIISFMYRDNFSYIENLNRTIKVPSIVFPIVWSILYLLMGVFYHFLDKDYKGDKLKNVYWISLFINLMFTPILFGINSLILASIDVVLLLILVLYMFVITLKRKKIYGYFLLPYLVWSCVALTLMIDLLISNF